MTGARLKAGAIRVEVDGVNMSDAQVERHALEADAGAVDRRMLHLRSRHELILDAAGEGIFGLDRRGCVTFVNPAAAQALGWRADELIGRRLHELAHHSHPDGRHYPAAQCPIYAAMADGTARRREDEVFWRRDGSSFSVEYASSPLRENDEVVGAVVVFSDISRRHAAEIRLRDSERRTRGLAAEHAALRRVATAVAADVDYASLIELVAREVAMLVGAEEGRVVRAGTDDDVDGGAMSRVRAAGKPVAWCAAGRTEVAAPVWVGASLWGCVAVSTGGTLSDGARERVANFAELVSMGIANADSRDRIVADTAAAILEGRLDMDATLAAIARAAQRALGGERASCFVHEGPDLRVTTVHTTATDPQERAFLEASVGMLMARMPIGRLLMDEEEPLLVVDDVSDDARIPPRLAGKLGSGSVVGVRLEHRSVSADGRPTLLGTLFVSFREPQRHSPRAVSAVRSLGAIAALAIANARLHAQALSDLARAEERAALDPLTGLANHGTFHESFRRRVAEARAAGTPLSLALLDLDHFKHVNDTRGHQVGDRVLHHLASRMRALARTDDLVARVGGDEFAWLMPGADAADALAAVERVRAVVGGPDAAGEVTVSAGVCDLAVAATPEELLERADGALYWAKANGRDAAIGYSSEVVTDLSAEERAERLERARTMAGLRALARAVDAKDPATLRHSERVAHMAARLATAAGWSPARTALLHEAGLLHDVGKIGIPDAVLFKPGRLTPEEYEEVKRHAALGAAIATDVLRPEQVAWVRHHHERWDGGGYPDGLAGDLCPEGAQFLALADAWDVMTSHRSYKRPLAVREALEDCRAQRGRQFAPVAVEALVELMAAGAPEGAADAERPEEEPAASPAPRSFGGGGSPGGLAETCGRVLPELREAMGWEIAVLGRIKGDELHVVATAGSDLIVPGAAFALEDTFCRLMLAGAVPPACGRVSDPASPYRAVPAHAALGIEAYSGHPVLLSDGSVFGTLCVFDRAPQEVLAAGRHMGEVLSRLLAWELQRETLATALGRARLGLATD